MVKTTKVVIATCLLGLGSTAGAATVDLGEVAANSFVGGSLIFANGATIDDEWTFTIASDLQTDISVDANDADPVFEISDFVVSSVSPALLFTYDAADNAYTFSGLLAAGEYTIDISGNVTGSLAGQYGVLVGAVPIPAALWMFGAAVFGLMASGARRA